MEETGPVGNDIQENPSFEVRGFRAVRGSILFSCVSWLAIGKNAMRLPKTEDKSHSRSPEPQHGAVGFTNHLIILEAKAHGRSKLITFDTRLAKTGRAVLLK